MKRIGKYITTDILLACLSTPPGMKKDIHTQLKETIAERKRIIQQWESSFLVTHADIKNVIHTQEGKTINGQETTSRQRETLFSREQDCDNVMMNKTAA